MIIEAGLTRYEKVNEDIKNSWRPGKKLQSRMLTAKDISDVLLIQEKPLRCTALRVMIWLAI